MTPSLKTNKLFCCDLNCWMNINFRCSPAVVNTDFIFFYSGFFSLLFVGLEGYCCTWWHSVTYTCWDYPWARDQPVAETSTMTMAGFESAIPAGERPQNGRPPVNVKSLKLRQEPAWSRYSRSKKGIRSVRPVWRMSWATWLQGAGRGLRVAVLRCQNS